MTRRPEKLVPRAQQAPTVSEIADSIQSLRYEAQNRSESHFAEIADEMEWLVRELLQREHIDYDRGR